jgi:hypothetical protein
MVGELVAIAQKLSVSISARRCLAETSAYLLNVVSWAPIEHSAYFDLASLQKIRVRGRVRLGHDAKQIQKCRHARRVEVDQLAYYTGVEVRVPYIPINVLSDVGTHGRFQVM